MDPTKFCNQDRFNCAYCGDTTSTREIRRVPKKSRLTHSDIVLKMADGRVLHNPGNEIDRMEPRSSRTERMHTRMLRSKSRLNYSDTGLADLGVEIEVTNGASCCQREPDKNISGLKEDSNVTEGRSKLRAGSFTEHLFDEGRTTDSSVYNRYCGKSRIDSSQSSTSNEEESESNDNYQESLSRSSLDFPKADDCKVRNEDSQRVNI